ncbi:MAG: gamma carbonic anhydrase family protein [Candidatus Thorarchaeota archaeon]|jgi:carbonic anhydrase/acetyltransferase-like protein (isoleucine patch superfamily)
MPILEFGGKTPKIDSDAFVSLQATIVGDVEIGPKVSVWPGAVIRGDHASVRIGESSCIQDSVVIHAHTDDNPTIIGNQSVIGTASVVHGVYVGDNASIGEGCVLFDGATLGEGVMLAPGSIVPANVVIPPRSLNSGAPAAQMRELSREEVEKQALKAETIALVFQKLRRWQQTT